MAELRAAAAYQSPVETVARVLNDIGIREVTAGWGPDAIKAMQRQRNLDAFLNLAVEYEKYCESQHEAATLTGFLFWVQNPHSPELDLQPTVTTGDAVHVLTYHGAKGLEWPVVVTADFDYTERSDLWDVRVNLTAPFRRRRAARASRDPVLAADVRRPFARRADSRRDHGVGRSARERTQQRIGTTQTRVCRHDARARPADHRVAGEAGESRRRG